MLERRNSSRLPLPLKIRETNGDYLFTLSCLDLGEEGAFVSGRVCVSTQEPFSRLSFTLPNGVQLRDITARIVRENRKGSPQGCAFEFMNLREEQRIELKRALLHLAS